jgi:hypothetical protein
LPGIKVGRRWSVRVEHGKMRLRGRGATAGSGELSAVLMADIGSRLCATYKIDVAHLCNGLSQTASGIAKSLPIRRRRSRVVYFIVDLEIMVLQSLVMVEFRSSYSAVVAWGLVSCNSSATTSHYRKSS